MCNHNLDVYLYNKLKDLINAHIKRSFDTFKIGSLDKLAGMFKDIELSRNINPSFGQHATNMDSDSTNIDLTVNVLTMGY